MAALPGLQLQEELSAFDMQVLHGRNKLLHSWQPQPPCSPLWLKSPGAEPVSMDRPPEEAGFAQFAALLTYC